MRARVCARVRTPQGVGALLLVGGAIVGAAVVVWRRRGDGKGAKNHHREQPPKEEVLDGGVVEDEQGKFDQSDGNLSREDTEVGANGLDDKGTEELHEIQEEEDEIVADELDSGPVEKFDLHSSRRLAEIVADDTFWLQGSGDLKEADQNSRKSGVENEITPNATEGAENSDQSTLTISSPEIAHKEHDDGAQGTASTQTTLTTQMVAHQPQISEKAKTDTVTETTEAELAEGTTMQKNVSEQEEQKSLTQPGELVTSPAISSLPSLPKPPEKKGLAGPGWRETGMKLEQDYTDGELCKGGGAQGVAVVTMDRRAASMAILVIIFAVTIGVNIVVRLYSTLRAT